MWTRTLSTTISTSPLRAVGSSLAMTGLSHADPVGRRQRLRTPPRAEPAHEEAGRDAGDEPADVLEQGDAAARARHAEGGHAIDQLEDEPEAEDDHRRDLQQLVEEAEEDERQDPGSRVENDVRPENRRD